MPQELVEAQQRVDANVAAMVHAIANHQFEKARVLADQEREARENLRLLRREIRRRIRNECLASSRGLRRKRPQQLFGVQRARRRLFVLEEHVNIAA